MVDLYDCSCVFVASPSEQCSSFFGKHTVWRYWQIAVLLVSEFIL